MIDSLLGITGATGAGGVLLAIIGLIILLALVIWIGRSSRRRSQAHGLPPGHRLVVIDQVAIDENRRLVLIQRDEVQHLVILGGGSDFLVEAGIGRIEHALDVATDTHHQPIAAPKPAPRAAPEPVEARPVHEPRAERAPPPAAPEAPDEFLPPIPAPTRARPVEPQRSAAPRFNRPETVAVPRPVVADPRAAQPAVEPPAPRHEPVARPEPVARAEPVIRPEPVARPEIARPEPAPRIEPAPRAAAKLDPFFAGMVDELEDTLKRPIPSQQVVPPAPTAPATPAPVTPRAQAIPGTLAFESLNTPPMVDVAPQVQPVEPPPAPAAETAAPEVLPPTAPTADDRAPAPVPTVKPPAGEDFELEMANILGRARRT